MIPLMVLTTMMLSSPPTLQPRPSLLQLSALQLASICSQAFQLATAPDLQVVKPFHLHFQLPHVFKFGSPAPTATEVMRHLCLSQQFCRRQLLTLIVSTNLPAPQPLRQQQHDDDNNGEEEDVVDDDVNVDVDVHNGAVDGVVSVFCSACKRR